MEKRLEVVWLWRANGSTSLDWRREIEAIKKEKKQRNSDRVCYVKIQSTLLVLTTFFFPLDLSS